MNLDPTPSQVELVNDNPIADSIWKRWFNTLSILVSRHGKFIDAKGLVFADSPYSITSDDSWLLCDPVSGSMTLNLPAGKHLRVFSVKNYAATGTNTVTIVPDGAELIEGATSYSVAKGSTVVLAFSEEKSQWYTIL